MDVCVMTSDSFNHVLMLGAGSSSINPVQLLLLALGIGALTLVMISTRNRIRRSQSSSRVSALERYSKLSEERSATRDLETVMLELDQLSRQIHGRLDTKLARIEALIRDADLRIEKLGRLQRAAAGEPTIDITLEPAMPEGETAESASYSEPDPHESVYRLAESGLSAIEIAHELGLNAGEVELILSLRRARTRSGYANPVLRPAQPTSR